MITFKYYLFGRNQIAELKKANNAYWEIHGKENEVLTELIQKMAEEVDSKPLVPVSFNVLELAKLITDPEEYLRLRMAFLANRTLYDFKDYIGFYRYENKERVNSRGNRGSS